MKKIIITFLFLFFFSIQIAYASDQVIMSFDDDLMSTGTTEYNGLMGAGLISGNWNSTENVRTAIISTNGTFKNLRIQLDGSPGAGKSYAFALMVNGAGTIGCTVSDLNTSCTETVSTQAVSAGNVVSLRQIPSGTPTARTANWTIMFSGDTAAESILMSYSELAITSGRSMPLHAGRTDDASGAEAQTYFAFSGTLKNFYAIVNTAPGTGNSWTFAVGNSTCTISDTNTTCNDLVNTTTVTAPQGNSILQTATGTPAATTVEYGITFLANTDGEFPIAESSDDNISNAAAEYGFIYSGDFAWNATETAVDNLSQSMTVKNIAVKTASAPGAGKSYVFALRINAVASSPVLSCTVSDTANTCSASASVIIANDDLLDTQASPSGTPTASLARVGYTGFIQPAGGAARRVILVQ